MDILELISELEEKIDSSLEIPLIKKAFVNKEELMNLVGDISLQLPDEVRMAKSIAEDRTRILADAQKQADLIIKTRSRKSSRWWTSTKLQNAQTSRLTKSSQRRRKTRATSESELWNIPTTFYLNLTIH